MKKEKQICDFGIKNYNLTKRIGVEKALRPGTDGSQKGKSSKRDTTAPLISNIAVSNITDNSVTISWTTNEETTSFVQYGTTVGYGLTKSSTGTTSHSVILTGLAGSTLYNFKITATDLAQNITVGTNNIFTTSGVVPNVLYLEFYGTTVSGTNWNVYSPSMTMAHSGLTDDEVAIVLAKVQDHFSQFNIIVTNDINLYNATAYNKKQKVIFTESYEWFGSTAGGVATLNSFGLTDPAFVFTSLLGYNVHNIAEAGAHESGHTMGCRHQVTCDNGVITSQYNWGDGVTAPIMGASYNVTSGDWWIGPNSLGCAVIQDDISIITSKIGLK